jgi:hypothetical protein
MTAGKTVAGFACEAKIWLLSRIFGGVSDACFLI